MSRPRFRATAFTLIELLVVIAIIALLVGILMPALTGARERGFAVKCQSNMKELSRAETLYVNDWFMFSPTIDNLTLTKLLGYRKPSGQLYDNGMYGQDWLGIGDQSSSTIIPGDPNDPMTGNPMGFAAAPKFGVLFKYYMNENMIRCPSDGNQLGGYQPNQIAPFGNGKFSYTMMSVMGLQTPEKIPADTSWVAGTTRSPALAPLFVEEHPDGPNNAHAEGTFGAFDTGHISPPQPSAVGDKLVSRHKPYEVRPGINPNSTSVITDFAQGYGNMGFADGHAEIVKPNFGFNVTQATMPGYSGLPNHLPGIIKRYGIAFDIRPF